MDPDGTGPLIRDLSGKVDLLAKGQRVHIDTAYDISMPDKHAPGIAAAPDAPLDFLFPAAYWTPARCPPLRAGEALDASCFGFVGQISHILAVLPLCHALIMMPSAVSSAHAIWVANEEGTHALLLAKDNHLARAFVAEVAYLPPLAGADPPPDSL